MRLLAITVLFHPDQDAFLNIGRYLSDVDCLIIWDNTPSKDRQYDIISSLQNIYQQKDTAKIQIMGTGRNEGLSFAYNRAIEYAQQNDYTHLMTMDQDSQWEDFASYKYKCEGIFANQSMAIIGPVINDLKRDKCIIRVPHVINSGALVPISTFKKVGKYTERFIVDAIDVEICFRANLHNIPTYSLGGYGNLKQKYGEPSYFIFRGSRRQSYNYNSFRLYGIIRNHILLTRIYPEQKGNISRTYNVYLKEFAISIIFNERNKVKKLTAMTKGLLNGLFTAKTVDSQYSKA